MELLIRETSLEAYSQVKEHLPKSRKEIYGVLCAMGKASTSGEVFEAMCKMNPNTSLTHNLNQVRARFTMLRDEGVIGEVSKRTCSYTGYGGITWLPTGRMPVKKVKTENKKTALLRKIEEFRTRAYLDKVSADELTEIVVFIKKEF